MSSKTVHICDSCHSYIDSNVITANITLTEGVGGNHYRNSEYHDGRQNRTNVRRDICPVCADKVIDILNIFATSEEVQKEAFKEFTLPAR